MQPMIGKDTVLLLLNHRINLAKNDLRLGNCNMVALMAQIRVLEEIIQQLDFILPIDVPIAPTEQPMIINIA